MADQTLRFLHDASNRRCVVCRDEVCAAALEDWVRSPTCSLRKFYLEHLRGNLGAGFSYQSARRHIEQCLGLSLGPKPSEAGE